MLLTAYIPKLGPPYYVRANLALKLPWVPIIVSWGWDQLLRGKKILFKDGPCHDHNPNRV